MPLQCELPSSAPPAADVAPFNVRAFPNPGSRQVDFCFCLPTDGAVQASSRGITGRRVGVLLDATFHADRRNRI
ncbi:MAG: hypothetical protein KAY32_02690 [Candidatus Eisenbacteria sp.]|nr:hypothetical protein [Candidatus Eisenbacteria bacterium]